MSAGDDDSLQKCSRNAGLPTAREPPRLPEGRRVTPNVVTDHVRSNLLAGRELHRAERRAEPREPGNGDLSAVVGADLIDDAPKGT